MYETGTIVAGKYRIERMIGAGGMGMVFAATHLQLGTPVALKFMHASMTTNQNVVDRFMREAQSSARLRGENVCRVSDVGTENGCPFIVMELLGGQDLGTLLATSGPLAISTAAEVIMQACVALGEAHQLGFVHRDVKPGNLFWTQRPDGTACIKVLDFGVAKAPEEIKLSLTQTANVIGSPGYMSPEQLKSSKNVDPRSDIWSLGIVLYELVSGRKPFHGDTITELALRVAMDPLPPLGGGLPASFEHVISRCLEKEPARRFKDVAELAQALAPYVGPVRGQELAYAVTRVLRTSMPMIASPPPVHGASSPTTLRGASGVVSGRTSVRNLRLPVVIGLGAAVGIAIALVMLMSGSKQPSTAAAPPAASVETVKKMEVAPAPASVAATARTPAAPAVVEQPAPASAPAAAKPVETKRVAAKPAAPKTAAKPATKKPAAKKPAKQTATKPKPRPKQPSAEDLSDSRL